jgi:hypothetical protein
MYPSFAASKACCDSIESQQALDSLKNARDLRKTGIHFFAARSTGMLGRQGRS